MRASEAYPDWMTSSTRISVFIGPRSRMIISTAPVTAPTVRTSVDTR